jgi:Putative peptidoglycan binding domain
MRRVPNPRPRPRTMLSLAAMAFALLLASGLVAQIGSAQSSSSSSGSSTTHKKKKSSSHHRSRREPFQKAPTAARISEIQSALAREGYYQGDPNGKWDGTTVSALQKFQSANNLDASGKLDASSLQKLGLGSSTAGLNPPTPPQRNTPAAATPGAGSATSTPAKTQSASTPINSASNASSPAQPR